MFSYVLPSFHLMKYPIFLFRNNSHPFHLLTTSWVALYWYISQNRVPYKRTALRSTARIWLTTRYSREHFSPLSTWSKFLRYRKRPATDGNSGKCLSLSGSKNINLKHGSWTLVRGRLLSGNDYLVTWEQGEDYRARFPRILLYLEWKWDCFILLILYLLFYSNGVLGV